MMNGLRVLPQNPVHQTNRKDGFQFSIVVSFLKLTRVKFAAVIHQTLNQSGKDGQLYLDI